MPLLLLSHSALAANLLHGEFDQPQDVYDWNVDTAQGQGSMSWAQSPDQRACAGSGSALLVASSPDDLGVEYSACANGVVPGQQFAFGYQVLFPNGQSEGWLTWGATWYDQLDCAGADLMDVSIGPNAYAPGWQPVEFWMTTPAGARSARVRLWVSSRSSTQSLPVHVDHVFVRPVADVFADGFELGEACRWQIAP